MRGLTSRKITCGCLLSNPPVCPWWMKCTQNLDQITKRICRTFFSTMEDTDDCQLNGCCTTVTILMVWLCLRFGCRDPQVMADALRCVLEHARHRAKQLRQRNPGGENQMMKFLFQLRAWQNQMVDTEDWTHDDFLKWLKIRVEPEARSYRGLR